MPKLTHQTVTDLLEAFSSSTPTPGGGSASALAGAVGTSLLLMVASLPKNRATNGDEQAALAQAAQRLREIRDRLAELVDLDAAAYDAVVAAYKHPKGSDEQQSRRREAIQAAMHHATETPLEVMRACRTAAEHGTVVAMYGLASAASDVRVAFELLGAGLRGARRNVDINLDALKDGDLKARIRGESIAIEQEFDRARVRAGTDLRQ